MKTKSFIAMMVVMAVIFIAQLTSNDYYYFHSELNKNKSTFGAAYAYPPAVGILSNSKNCISCHTNNGPWKDDSKTIIDILDRETKQSFKQPDGSFLIEIKRGEQKTVLTKRFWFSHLISLIFI